MSVSFIYCCPTLFFSLLRQGATYPVLPDRLNEELFSAYFDIRIGSSLEIEAASAPDLDPIGISVPSSSIIIRDNICQLLGISRHHAVACEISIARSTAFERDTSRDWRLCRSGIAQYTELQDTGLRRAKCDSEQRVIAAPIWTPARKSETAIEHGNKYAMIADGNAIGD